MWLCCCVVVWWCCVVLSCCVVLFECVWRVYVVLFDVVWCLVLLCDVVWWCTWYYLHMSNNENICEKLKYYQEERSWSVMGGINYHNYMVGWWISPGLMQKKSQLWSRGSYFFVVFSFCVFFHFPCLDMVDMWSISGDKKIRAGAGGIPYLFVIIIEVYAKCHGQRLWFDHTLGPFLNILWLVLICWSDEWWVMWLMWLVLLVWLLLLCVYDGI